MTAIAAHRDKPLPRELRIKCGGPPTVTNTRRCSIVPELGVLNKLRHKVPLDKTIRGRESLPARNYPAFRPYELRGGED